MNMTSQPVSQSVTTDMSEWVARPGIMCPIFARVGRTGMSSWHSWVDVTLFLSGRVTMICFNGVLMVAVCSFVIKKWLVAPELRIAHL